MSGSRQGTIAAIVRPGGLWSNIGPLLFHYAEQDTISIELSWEEACLSPHKNKRSVRTASQQQVRQKVYKGSSEAWRKYEPYLNGAFDSLKSK